MAGVVGGVGEIDVEDHVKVSIKGGGEGIEGLVVAILHGSIGFVTICPLGLLLLSSIS